VDKIQYESLEFIGIPEDHLSENIVITIQLYVR
jgi:hypothetical protein